MSWKIVIILIIFLMVGGYFLIRQVDHPNSSSDLLATSSHSTQAKLVSASEFNNLVNSAKNDPSTILIDLRTQQEYDSGHIDGSKVIDYYSSDFKNQLNQLDKSKTYLVYCNSGHRSGLAVNIMKQLGFNKIYELDGGIQAWNRGGLPIVR